MKINVVFFGTPEFVIPLLETLASHFTLSGVVTTPDAPQGRKKVITPSPVKIAAQNLSSSLPIFTPDSLQEIEQELQALSPDVFIVAAYGKIIPQSILDIPQFGSLNVHPSLLPKYRGPSPIQTAIVQGNTETGVSIIKMDAQMDHGPLVAQWKTPIQETDTFTSLHKVLFGETAQKLPTIITNYIEGTITPHDQDESQVVYCQKITKESGYFSLETPPPFEKLDAMIRGYYPWPTAWTRIHMGSGETKILKLFPGKRVQLEGGKEMELKDFLNGYPELKPQLQQLFQKD